MSLLNGLLAQGSNLSSLTGRLRIVFMRNPEWWVWGFSLFVWTLLFVQPFIATNEGRSTSRLLYCMTTAETTHPEVNVSTELQSILKPTNNGFGATTAISDGLIPWIIMIIAMMFPLLNEPVRHVAFSVRQKDRDLGISWFLLGYTGIWSLIGILFLLLPSGVDRVIGNPAPTVSSLINVSGFLLAAIIVWLPNRPVAMTRCSETMPIRIHGWQLHADCFTYGLKMGVACLRMCWAPMAALMVAHHNVILMFVATVILLLERYRLPHTSKLPGYAWVIIALTLLGAEMWGRIF